MRSEERKRARTRARARARSQEPLSALAKQRPQRRRLLAAQMSDHDRGIPLAARFGLECVEVPLDLLAPRWRQRSEDLTRGSILLQRARELHRHALDARLGVVAHGERERVADVLAGGVAHRL